MKSALRNIKKKYIVLGFAFFLMTGFFSLSEDKPTNSQSASELTPTVFVHGFKGGPQSFGTMIHRLEEKEWGSEGMVFHISADGDIQVTGDFSGKKNPSIQILFENNRARLADQTIWLQEAMTMLRSTHDIQQVNLVGHSMGGLTSTNYLLNNEDGNYPEVEKLVVMGSPFKGIHMEEYFEVNYGEATKDLHPQSEALTSMVDNKARFDEETLVLAIAGQTTIEPATDNLVTVESAFGIRDIARTDQYSEEMFRDKMATHSGLHEHPGVDKTVAEFLWESK
ncbi:alpha/beta fold hydrolase [Alteribacillus sp. HJP-4]|uniref:alpha/beta fold hydrolase n=1 Tax=Alteribacillus sp. HJP-4 TaxID=2775394 RepID=UPI0035CD29B6